MKPLTATDMDRVCDRGCQEPDCDHRDCPSHELWMHQQCHKGAPTVVLPNREGTVLACLCLQCRELVAAWDIVTAPLRTACPTCDPDEPGCVRLSYVKGSRTLQVHCYFCEQVLDEAVLQG